MMKKLLYLFALLTIFVSGTNAQVYTTATGQNYLKADQIIAKASSGDLLVALQLHTTSSNKYLNSEAKMNDSFASDGETTWKVVPYGNDGYYALQSVKTGKYIGNSARPTTFTDDVVSATLFLPEAVDNIVGDIASGYTAKDNAVRWKVAPGKTTWINANGASASTTVQFNGGTGNWTCWFTYEVTENYNITFNCLDESDSPIIDPVTELYADGSTVYPPVIAGKKLADGEPESYVVSGADATYTIHYVSSSFDYTVAINAANPLGTVITTEAVPAGTLVTIKGAAVANGDNVSYNEAVTENDVVVTFPSGYEYMAADVTISGATITVDCYDPRWPINFSKDQKYTRTDRFINNVRIGSKTFSITNSGLNTPAYRDFTNEVLVVPAGATLVPAIGYTGAWMHGFFYVDLDNDGQFYVENPGHTTAANTEYNGELLSYGNEGNALNSNQQEMPAFVMPTTPGDYRARFKMDWASTDPGGNPGADINNVTSSNHIIANGGTIVDITLRILPPADVTYIVVDESNNELFRATEALGVGETITTLPEAYQRSDFYEYSTVDETVTGDMDITFTATLKDNLFVQFTADATTPVWNFLTIRPDNSNQTGYPTYVAEGTPNVTLPAASAMDETTMWAFVGNPYTGFQIINKAAGTNLVLGSESAAGDGANGGNTYATLAAKGTQTYETWTIQSSDKATNGFFISNAEGQYLNRRSSANLAYWTGGHDMGSTFVATTVQDAYDELVASLEAYSFGKGLNQYSLVVSETDVTANAVEMIATLKSEGYSLENLATAKAMKNGLTLNMPTAGFYRFMLSKQKVAEQPYLLGELSTLEDHTDRLAYSSDASNANSIWYFDGSNLYNYGRGGYALVNNSDQAAVANPVETEAASVVFSASANGELGAYNVQFSGRYLYGQAEGYADAGGSANGNGYNFNIEEVDALPVTISSAKFATLYAPVALTIPAGVEVYTATDDDDKYLHLNEIQGQTIPANTGVILKGEAGTYNFDLTDDVTPISNALTGTVAAIARPEGSYILATGTAGVAFYKDGAQTIPGFKAYLAASTGSNVKTFVFGDETAVKAIEAAQNSDKVVYDMSGRRVLNPAKGLYILNGKKVVIK